VTLEI